MDLTLGRLPFPDATRPRTDGVPDRARLHLPLPPLLPDALRVTLTEELVVRSGDNLRSSLVLHNGGPEKVVVNTNGQVTAPVVDPATGEIVGVYTGVQTIPLKRFRASPGQVVEIPLFVGTASTTARLGYAVPPGRWAIQATLGLDELGHRRTPLLPITVLQRRDG